MDIKKFAFKICYKALANILLRNVSLKRKYGGKVLESRIKQRNYGDFGRKIRSPSGNPFFQL